MNAFSRRGLRMLALTTAFALTGGAAWAFWSVAGAGAGNASTTTLAAPSNVAGSPSSSTVALTWTGTTAPGGGPITGYYVLRSPGTAAGTCTSSPASMLAPAGVSCTDTGVGAGTYTYTVVAVFRSWTASAASAPVTVAPVVADHFVVVAPTTATAGTAFSVTVTAKDAANATLTTYSGSKTLLWSGPGTAPNGSTPTYPATVSFTNGVGTASVTLTKAESTTLTASQGGASGTSGAIAVGAVTASQFGVSASTPQAAGTPFSVTVTALDAYRNVVPGFTGAQSLVWTGPGTAPNGTAPTYPASVTFTNGVSTASVTLPKAETKTLTATLGSITGTSSAVVVTAGSAARLAWTQVTISGGTLSSPCLFTCTGTGVGNFGTFTAHVAVTDTAGNPVSNLGAPLTVTVSTPTSGAGSGGTFTAPTAGTSVTLTIPATGTAESTGPFIFRATNGNWTSNTFTATAGSYTAATGSVTKQ